MLLGEAKAGEEKCKDAGEATNQSQAKAQSRRKGLAFKQQHRYTETRSRMVSDGVVLTDSMHHLLAGDPAVKSQLLRPSAQEKDTAKLQESTCSITALIFEKQTPVCPERDIHQPLQVCLLLIWKLREPSELVLQDTSNMTAARQHSHTHLRAFKRRKSPPIQGCRGRFQALHSILHSSEKPVTGFCSVPPKHPQAKDRDTKRTQHCFQ